MLQKCIEYEILNLFNKKNIRYKSKILQGTDLEQIYKYLCNYF
jgi:hypothetical protein